MTGNFLPILLAVLGTIAALLAYRNVQRGGARFYQLERDALLRRASFAQLASLVLFVASIGLLIYGQSQAELIEDEGFVDASGGGNSAEVVPAATPTLPASNVVVQSQPPTLAVEPTATPDANAPTLTPTAIVRRAEIKNTGGSGAYLRDGPSTQADDLQVLDEGTLVTLLDDEPTDSEGYNWMRVRTLGGTEGYVVDLYLVEFQR